MRYILFFVVLFLVGCNEEPDKSISKKEPSKKEKEITQVNKKIHDYFEKHKGNDLPSQSIGTTGNGKLINGKLLPSYGKNFQYFSEVSYFMGRAFVHHKVRDLLIESFDSLYIYFPKDTFYIMETSHKNGGKFFPHRTHQNGLSVDLMMPYLKNSEKYSGLDRMGILHYSLQFTDNAQWEKDKSITPDFEKIAFQLYMLNKLAAKNGLQIAKIIIKTEWVPYLLATKNAKKYQLHKLPFVRSLAKIVNEQHDDHFHLDFIVVNN